MLPTLVPAAGEPDAVEKCKKGYKAGKKTFKVHLDGYNMLPYLKGEVEKGPRHGFLYWGDEGDYWRCAMAIGKFISRRCASLEPMPDRSHLRS